MRMGNPFFAGLTDQFDRPAVSEETRRRMIPDDVGKNVPNSVADVGIEPEWLPQLRELSPMTELHSWLQPYWYRLRARWVLYDCVHESLIPLEEPILPGMEGWELLSRLSGPAPRDLPDGAKVPHVSDVQHEMFRRWQVYARPFWVLQGERGGHQYRFSPDQKQFLTSVGLHTDPPAVGSLPACPFDTRVTLQLQRVNRLYVLNGSLAKLRASGSSEAADAQAAIAERETREIAMRMLGDQLGEVGEMVSTMGKTTAVQEAGVTVDARGQASKAAEAIAAYIETGNYIL